MTCAEEALKYPTSDTLPDKANQVKYLPLVIVSEGDNSSLYQN